MTDFINTLSQLNLLPAFAVAMLCGLGILTSIIIGIVAMFKDIHQC